MGVLSFRRRAGGGSTTITPTDWTQQDLADFYRAYNLLQQNGVGIGMDRGLTDRGEPWLVFYDTASQDVFIHVARIDGECVLVSETLELKLAAPSIGDLITRFEDKVQTLVQRRAERPRNVVLHPAARMIMAITATFLLFKLENSGQAHAGEHEDPFTNPDAVRKGELSAAARVHQALARLLDSVDGPTAIAAVASLMIAAEISKLDLSSGSGETVVLDGVAGAELAGLKAALHEAELSANAGEGDAAAWLANGSDILANVEVAAADAADAIHVAIDYEEILARAAELVELSRDTPPVEQDLAAHAEQALPIGDGQVLALIMTAQAALGVSAALDMASKAAATGVLTASPAFDVLQKAIGADLLAQLFAGASARDGGVKFVASDGSLDGAASAIYGDGLVGKISNAALDAFAATVGHVVDASVDRMALASAIDIFRGAVKETSGYAMERDGAILVIEQLGLADRDMGDLSMWKGQAENGAVVAIVGHSDLIDHIDSLLG